MKPHPMLFSATPKLAFFAAVLLVSAAPVALAQYLPLETGNQWNYVSESGAAETQTVTGQISLFGGMPWVIEYTGDTNDGLSNFWTSNEQGDVFAWGFYISGDFGVAYDPPIQFLDGPLEVGKTWSQTVDLYSYPDLVYQQTFDIAFEVYEEADLDLPAGTFHSFAVGQSAPPLPFREGFDLAGRTVGSDTGSYWDWWSFGVGLVQYRSIEVYQLESLGGPVPVQDSSWGRIKMTFSERTPTQD